MVRVETTIVVNNALVLDRQGRSVQGLTRSDFIVTEDGKPQEVGIFLLGDSATIPRSIVLIIDYSCSQSQFVETSIAAAKVLVDNLGQKDRMAIVTDDVELLSDFTSDKKKLKDKLDFLKMKAMAFFSNSTNLSWEKRLGLGYQYRALMATLKEMFDDEDQRPIIIFQTDDSEAGLLRNSIINLSVPDGLSSDWKKKMEDLINRFQKQRQAKMREFSLDDIYKAAELSRVTIYTVIPGFQLIGLMQDKQIEQIKAYNGNILMFCLECMELMREIVLAKPLSKFSSMMQRYDSNSNRPFAVLSTLTGGWSNFLETPSQASDIYTRMYLI